MFSHFYESFRGTFRNITGQFLERLKEHASFRYPVTRIKKLEIVDESDMVLCKTGCFKW